MGEEVVVVVVVANGHLGLRGTEDVHPEEGRVRRVKPLDDAGDGITSFCQPRPGCKVVAAGWDQRLPWVEVGEGIHLCLELEELSGKASFELEYFLMTAAVVVVGHSVTSFSRLATNCLGVEVKMRSYFRSAVEIEIVPE